MATSTHMKMVNGRVSEQSVAKAARTLKREGLTVSAFIRNSIEHIAREGTVPACGFPHPASAAKTEQLRDFIASIEARPMPGKREFAGLDEDELVERLRMERYGY